MKMTRLSLAVFWHSSGEPDYCIAGLTWGPSAPTGSGCDPNSYLYLQNQTVTGTASYDYESLIKAGRNVDPTEDEGDFVVGVLAGLITQTHMVGFIGGGVTPIVRRIELGFAQGVENVDASISFISDYVGEFDDPIRGRLLAETQYTLGVDVICQVAGRCGLGAIQAASEFGKWIISTGGDHSDLAPGAVLTSRIKNVGKAVFDVIQAVTEDRFEGGVKSYGFAEGGLTLATIRPAVFKVVTPAIQNIMQEIQAQVITGRIKVKLDD